jgi:hypothetical protein
MRRILRVARILLALLAPAPLSAGPPPLRDAEPLPFTRAPELARRPLELAPALTASLPLCRESSEQATCRSLGPALGVELAALYRPSPYFAFGGSFAYSRATPAAAGREVTRETTGLAVVGRVYLLEEGELDPYLEAQLGWANAPFGRAGGGVDWFVGRGMKLGVLAGYGEIGLRRGALTGGLGVSVLFGERL